MQYVCTHLSNTKHRGFLLIYFSFTEIEKVFVDNVPVDYEYTDVVTDLNLGPSTTIAHHQVYKTKYLNALRDADEGELNIKLPNDYIKQVTSTEVQLANTVNIDLQQPPTTATATATEDGGEGEKNLTESHEPQYNTFKIRIDYTLKDPRSGVVFVNRDSEVAPYRSNHVYTAHQPLPGATRSWLPCIDQVSERCTWDMEFVVPRKADGAPVPEYDGEGSFEEVNGITVVCSGDIIEQVIHPTDVTKKIVRYSLSVPTPAPFIGFAIGPFDMIKLSPSQLQEEVMNAADLDENQQQSLMAEINMMCNIYAFALPGLDKELNISCSFLMHAMHFYTQEYGSYPFSDYKLVFVEDTWADTASSASLTICNSRLLHSADVIDQIYSTRRELSQSLARQWFGIYIVPKSWPDTWLVRGLANLMGSLFIKRHLGNNEYRLRLKKDMELCCVLDVNRPPVYDHVLPYPLDPEDLEFIDLKAPLVLYMLDKRMCKGGGTLGLSRVLPKVLVSAMSGELIQNAISTHYFLRLCRKISGFDTRVFANQWVYRSGCPKFQFKFHFNRKKMMVEIHMSQENTNTKLNSELGLGGIADGSAANYHELMSPLFTGNLTVRIHEANGTPYEHILDIQSNMHKFDVPFNTKYKRIRRNTKRFLAKQAAAAAAVAEEEQENEDGGDGTMVLEIIPTLGLGMPMFEDSTQKKEWRIIEWGQDEEDTSGAASSMFDWIRLDAEFEWLCVCDFKQPDYMWAAQLIKDRDVVAQHEAINALKHTPSLATSTSLLRAVMDPKCFYKIRMEATYGLAACATPDLNWVGLHQLNKMFQKRYCFPTNSYSNSEMQEDELPITSSIPRPNNFSSLPDYFIQKASVVALSQIHDSRGQTPVRIRQFLLDLLKYNDNIGNEFSDYYYIATLVSALGDCLISSASNEHDMLQDDPESKQVDTAIKAEIERFRTLDYVIPTYHNIITVTCLRTMTKLMLKDVMPVNIQVFLQYTRYGNYLEVRLAAFDSLFILCGLSDPAVNRYLLSVIKEDCSVYISHYVARTLLAWLGLAMREGSEAPIRQNRFTEEFAEEDGRVVIDDERLPIGKTAQQEFQAGVENLRKRFENDTELQQSLWTMLNSLDNAKLDHCIRKYLLQFCEYVFKPIDVGLKVTIRVPTMPLHDLEDNSEPNTPVTQAPVIRLTKRKSNADEKPHKHHKKTNSIHIKTESTSQELPSSMISSTVSSPGSVDSDDMINIVEEPPKKVSIILPTEKIVSRSEPAFSTLPSLPIPSIPDFSSSQSIPKEPKTSTAPKPASLVITAPAPTPASTSTSVSDPIPASAPRLKSKHKKIGSTAAEELRKCRRIFNKLISHRSSACFIEKVDEIRDGALDYYKYIKKPMYLSLVKEKLKRKEYTTVKSFEDDICLMFNNCYLYNPPNTDVYNEGRALQAVFDEELASIRGNEREETQNLTIVESPATTPLAVSVANPFDSAPATNGPKTPSSSTLASALTPTTIVMKPPKPVKVKSLNTTVAEPLQKPTAALSQSATVKVSTSNFTGSPTPVASSENGVPVKIERKKSTTPVSAASSAARIATEKHTAKVKPMSEREKMETLLKATLVCEHALEFLQPVDPIKQNAPTYTKIVTHPMDLGTINTKFSQNQYNSIQDMNADVKLMLKNCYIFNPPNTYVYDKGKALEAYYDREYSKLFRRKSNTEKKKKAQSSPSAPPVSSASSASPIASSFEKPSLPAASSAPAAIKVKSLPKPKRSHSPSASTSSKPPKAPKIASSSAVNDNPAVYNNSIEPSPSIPESSEAMPFAPQNTQPPSSAAIPVAPVPVKKSKPKPVVPPFNPAMNEANKKKIDRISTKLWAHQSSQPFHVPVDAVALNVPQYYEVIKRPMDFSAIKQNYESNTYNTIWEFEKDVRQIFWNCYGFNDHESWVAKQCQALETFFNQIWSTEFAVPNAIKGDDKKVAQKVVDKLTLHDAAALFNEPVDLESLPDYGVAVKHPIDLRTIWEKLESGKYINLKVIDHDIRLVFNNCFTYNKAGSFGYEQGKKLEKYYQNISRDMRARINGGSASSTKRGPSASPAPAPSAAQ